MCKEGDLKTQKERIPPVINVLNEALKEKNLELGGYNLQWQEVVKGCLLSPVFGQDTSRMLFDREDFDFDVVVDIDEFLEGLEKKDVDVYLLNADLNKSFRDYVTEYYYLFGSDKKVFMPTPGDVHEIGKAFGIYSKECMDMRTVVIKPDEGEEIIAGYTVSPNRTTQLAAVLAMLY